MVRHRDVRIDGVRLSCAEWGEPDGPTVVLLHALGLSGDDWEGTAQRLAPDHRVLAPDMRGHRRSDWPGAYSFESMRNDVLGLGEALDLDHVTLVGHSMGGVVAWLVAQRRPTWLSRLVIEDVPVPSAGVPVPLGSRPDGTLRFDWAVIAAIVAQLNAPDPAWWQGLSRIEVPTVVLRGGPTSHVPQDKILACAAAVSGAEVVDIPVGHHIHRNAPDEFLAAWSAPWRPSAGRYSTER